MRKQFSVILLFFQLIFFTLQAQEKRLSLENSVLGRYREFNPANITGLKWIKNLDSYSWINNNSLWVQKAGNEKEESVLQLDDLNPILASKGFPPFRKLENVSWIAENQILLLDGDNWIVFNIKAKTIVYSIKRPEKSENEFFSEEARALAFTIDKNVYFTDSSGNLVQLSHDPDRNYVNGKTVSRNEFGINKGIFWSPAGNFLAFYRKDESRVGDYPIINIDTRIETVHLTKYPMAGMPSERISLGVYNIKQKSLVYIENDSASDKYLTCISWSPDEKYIFIAVLNRAQNHMWLNKYDAVTGMKIKTLFEEENPKYVEPNATLLFRIMVILSGSAREMGTGIFIYMILKEDSCGKLQRVHGWRRDLLGSCLI